MDIVVRAKNVDVPPTLREIAREKLAKISRFTSEIGRVEVDFSELRNPRIAENQLCEVTVHLKRHFVKAHAAATEALAALDLVIDKVEHQVARVKDKRVARSHPRRKGLQSSIQPGYSEPLDLHEGDDDAAAHIVKTKQFTIKPMAPSEAALQMDLLGHDFFFFTNSENGQAAVIYRRRDGHFGLIESTG